MLVMDAVGILILVRQAELCFGFEVMVSGQLKDGFLRWYDRKRLPEIVLIASSVGFRTCAATVLP